MNKPNLFIVGAPKCGTTSLAYWLSEHPQVFFSPVKEPHYFNFDYGERTYRSLSNYEKLFSGAREHHVAIGEASTRYLYSRTAVPAILNYTKNARFIIMVRNPVDMAYAWHEQLVFGGEENENDFENAWHLQTTRAYGGRTPIGVDPQHLLYGPLCCVGRQIERLLRIAPRHKTLILNLEHLHHNPQEIYKEVLSFLNLADDERQDFPIKNQAKQRRLPGVWNVTKLADRFLYAVGVPRVRLGITEFIHSWDRKERPRPPMSEAMKKQLRAYFSDDVCLLEELTGWDLRHWKEY